MIFEEACELIGKHGLLCCREENRDLPETERVEWILIARRQETLDRYRMLRGEGANPVRSLEPFFDLLSYDPEERVLTGYDAYREYFSK